MESLSSNISYIAGFSKTIQTQVEAEMDRAQHKEKSYITPITDSNKMAIIYFTQSGLALAP